MRADIGIALDGDADRMIIVDEKGHVVDGDQILAVIAESWQADGRLAKPGIVATVMSNLGLERHLAERRPRAGAHRGRRPLRARAHGREGLQRRRRAVRPHHPDRLFDHRRRPRRRDAGAGGGPQARPAGQRSLPPLRAAAAGVAQRPLQERPAARGRIGAEGDRRRDGAARRPAAAWSSAPPAPSRSSASWPRPTIAPWSTRWSTTSATRSPRRRPEHAAPRRHEARRRRPNSALSKSDESPYSRSGRQLPERR